MNILSGKQVEQEEATVLTFRKAGAEGLSAADITDMFTPLANDHRMSSEADKIIGTAPFWWQAVPA